MTTSTSAQDEFNELIRDKEPDHRHPEDRDHDSDASDPESAGAAADYLETTNTDDELDIPHNMRTNYYMPSLRSDANTGPKGVIADAQAFEQARKQAKRFTWKKNAAPTSYTVRAYHDKDQSSDEDGEDSFLKEWRAARLQELQNVSQKIRSRTNSPSRRVYGNMPEVDAEGYLDAIDKTASGTTVVVFVYGSDDSNRTSYAESRRFEPYMHEVAKRNDSVRFVKIDNDIAEIEDAGLPAVLAYRNGEKVADIVPLMATLNPDSELTAVSLETILRQRRVL